MLLEQGITFDVAFTSVLKRAIRTLWIVLDAMDLMWIPVHRSWRLNERHYGALQGLNKAETARSMARSRSNCGGAVTTFAHRPWKPRIRAFPDTIRRYAGLSDQELPRTECLKDTVARFLPYWHETIVPAILSQKRVLIAAHGNSLRALVKHLDKLSDDEIVNLNIPTGIPLLYELDDHLKPIRHEYLGDPEQLRQAIEAVAHQGKAAKVGEHVSDKSSTSERRAG